MASSVGSCGWRKEIVGTVYQMTLSLPTLLESLRLNWTRTRNYLDMDLNKAYILATWVAMTVLVYGVLVH